MTLNEALEAMGLYKARLGELNNLRLQNAVREDTYSYGEKTPFTKKEPMYSIKKIDKLHNKLAKELRVLESAVKKTNASTDVKGFENKTIDQIDLGELDEFDFTPTVK